MIVKDGVAGKEDGEVAWFWGTPMYTISKMLSNCYALIATGSTGFRGLDKRKEKPRKHYLLTQTNRGGSSEKRRPLIG